MELGLYFQIILGYSEIHQEIMLLQGRKYSGGRFTRQAVVQRYPSRCFSLLSGGQIPTKPCSFLICVILVTFSVPLIAADSFVGSIKTITGSPEIVRGSDILPASPGTHLSEKDILRTNVASRVGIILRDGTRISLGPDTEVSVESFLYNPAQEQLSLVVRLFRGVVAFVSGKIAALSPGSATVETPVGVIGLRGTKFAVALDIN